MLPFLCIYHNSVEGSRSESGEIGGGSRRGVGRSPVGLGGGFLECLDGQMGAGDVKRVVLGTFRGRIFILVAKQANTTHMYHYLYKFIHKIAFFQFSKIFSR